MALELQLATMCQAVLASQAVRASDDAADLSEDVPLPISDLDPSEGWLAPSHVNELGRLCAEINSVLAFEVDVARAVAFVLRRVVGSADVVRGSASPSVAAVEVACLCALRVAKDGGYSFAVAVALEELPEVLRQPGVATMLPGTVRAWLKPIDPGSVATVGTGGPQGGSPAGFPGAMPGLGSGGASRGAPVVGLTEFDLAARRRATGGSGRSQRPGTRHGGAGTASATAGEVMPGASENATDGFKLGMRVFIATPLTQIDQHEHDVLLAIAGRVAHRLRALGFQAEVPGHHLAPDMSDADNDVARRFVRERALIAGADLIVLVGCDADSWGMSKTATWAEASGAPVLMLGTGVQPWCRVLSAGPHRLIHTVVDSPAELDTKLNEAVLALMSWVAFHAYERTTLAAVIGDDLDVARRRLELLVKQPQSGSAAGKTSEELRGLTLERAREALGSAAVFSSASIFEIRQLTAFLGADTVGPLTDSLLHSAHSTRGRVLPRTAQRTLGSVEFHGLRAAATIEDWDESTVLELLVDYFTAEAIKGRAAQRRTGGAEDWLRRASALGLPPERNRGGSSERGKS